MEIKLKTSIFMLLLMANSFSKAINKSNVIIIIADDIGYGDLGCYGAKKIKTPNIDNIASKGVKFINAYAPCSTSSPSRYSLLTGEYAWRKNINIMSGDAPMSIDSVASTLPLQFKDAGYVTGIVGKWHLGLGSKDEKLDFNKTIKKGMKYVGFDYSYIFPATNDRVPTIFLENDLTVGLEQNDPISVSYRKKIGNDKTGKENPDSLRLGLLYGHDGTIVNGVSRIGWMSGGNKARWKDEEMGGVLLNKAVDFIDKNAQKNFFLYYAPHNAHEPRIPSPMFRGKSKTGVYGDVIEEFDYYVGEIIFSLKRNGIMDNTIIIITSDNGPRVKEAYDDGAAENLNGHNPFAGLRGEKYSIYEGGTRVPFICYNPVNKNNSFVQKQNFCYTDLFATLCSIADIDVTEKQLKDSKDASALFFDKKALPYRDYILTLSHNGRIALRQGDWKYIPKWGNSPAELYNLSHDSKEAKNLVKQNIDVVAKFEGFIKELNK